MLIICKIMFNFNKVFEHLVYKGGVFKMKVLGLITEYNPFHNGHNFHIQQAKEISQCDYVVCVMSGNFIQRGEPALINKWARAKMALTNGCDLVIELPTAYVLESAEYFAFGAVKILDSLRIVDSLCFGSEHGEIEPIVKLARILNEEPSEISTALKYHLKNGDSFPKAREKAVIEYLKSKDVANINANIAADDKPEDEVGDDIGSRFSGVVGGRFWGEFGDGELSKIMSSPNNILGIEYVKALYKLKSSITPLTIKRHKVGYHDLMFKDNIASATAIRNMLKECKGPTSIRNMLINCEGSPIKTLIPSGSFDILQNEINSGRGPIFSEHFSNALLTILRRMKPEQIALYPDVNEGLENRIYEATNSCTSIEDVIGKIKTKRYTHTRLMRILFNILMGIDKTTFNEFHLYGGPQYIRVLGMNSRGKFLLREANEKAFLPIIVKPSTYKKSCNPLLKKMMDIDILATNLYTLNYCGVKERKGGLDLKTSPIILK